MLKLLFISLSVFLSLAADPLEPWDVEKVKKDTVDYHQKRIRDFIPSKETNPLKYPFYVVFGGYRIFLSSQDGPTCQFRPSCSHYTIKAVKKYGPLQGLLMGADRIQRCHPYHPPYYRIDADSAHYYDPMEDHLLW